MLKIGTKIRQLREQKCITQAKMAQHLGITEQAISRWENGGGYPDMELIPAIANFLEISTDELFGLCNNDDEAEYKRKYAEMVALRNDDKWQESADYCRKELERRPRDYGWMFELAYSLRALSKEDNAALEEAVLLWERILEDCTDSEHRYYAFDCLWHSYVRLGRHQQAVELVEKMPPIEHSREMLLPRAMPDGEKRVERLQLNVRMLALKLNREIKELASNQHTGYTWHDKLRCHEVCLEIINILHTGDDSQHSGGWFWWYLDLAKIHADTEHFDGEKTLDYLLKAEAAAWKHFEWDIDQKYPYKGIFLNKILPETGWSEEALAELPRSEIVAKWDEGGLLRLIHESITKEKCFENLKDIAGFAELMSRLARAK